MDVFDYDDYRAFLRDWLDANPRLSHRDLMRRMGSRDPSVLARVLAGRRHLSDRSLGPLVRLLGLDPQGAHYFTGLVHLARARSEAEREVERRNLERLRTLQHARLIRDPSAYASWARVAVRELAGCPGFRDDPAEVAARFEPPLDVAVAEDALRHLRRDDTGARTTPPTVRHREVFAYYRGIHERTGRALDRLEVDPELVPRTLFLGLTLAVRGDRVELLRRRLHELQQELLALAEDGSPDEVIQVNLQLFPLTRRVAPRAGSAVDGVANATR